MEVEKTRTEEKKYIFTCMGSACSVKKNWHGMMNRLDDRGQENDEKVSQATLATKVYSVKTVKNRRFGNFCLVRALQSNNTSVVFSAKRIDWSKRVNQNTLSSSKVAYAVKIEHDNAQRKSSLLRETQILSRVSHLHVIKMSYAQVFGTVPHRQYLFAFMPLFETDLFTFVTTRGPLIENLDLVHTIVTQVCSGVAALHEAGIVHADLKTENILVKNANKEMPFFVVADLGSAYDIRNENYERIGHTLCTSSPEIVTDTVSLSSAASDVFSIGCMLSDIAFNAPIFGPQSQYRVVHLAKVQRFNLGTPFPTLVRGNRTYFGSNGYIHGYPPSRIRDQTSWYMKEKYKKGVNVLMMDFIRNCCCPDPRLRPSLEQIPAFTLQMLFDSQSKRARETAVDEISEQTRGKMFSYENMLVRRPRSLGTGMRDVQALKSKNARKKNTVTVIPSQYPDAFSISTAFSRKLEGSDLFRSATNCSRASASLYAFRIGPIAASRLAL